MRRARNPSRLRRRRLWLRRHPQQQAGDARHLCRQRQAAAGDQIELSRFAPDFQHDDTQRIAGQRVGGRPQRGGDVRGPHRHQAAGIETEFGEAAHRQRTGFKFSEILPHPHQRPPGAHPPSEPCDKTRRRGAVSAGFGEHLMHRPHSEATLQRRIRIGMPERHTIRRIGLALRLDALDAAAQGRKRARACAGHARRSFGRWAVTGLLKVNPRLAHLFMICSNIKLTPAAESIRSGI
jgi:hypothetical protein